MGFEVKLVGFEKFERRLKDLQRRARKHQGTLHIPLSELFPPRFLSRYTQFASLDDMSQASGFKVESQEDFDNIPDDQWDDFVAANTQFSSWEEMLGKAVEHYMGRKLGFR